MPVGYGISHPLSMRLQGIISGEAKNLHTFRLLFVISSRACSNYKLRIRLKSTRNNVELNGLGRASLLI